MDDKRQPKGDTKKDIDESMRKSGVDKVVKEQVDIIRKVRKDHRLACCEMLNVNAICV